MPASFGLYQCTVLEHIQHVSQGSQMTVTFTSSLADYFSRISADSTQTVTCTAPQSLRSWANHINGAKAIALTRGAKQIETETGRHIFALLRNQIVSTAMAWINEQDSIT